MYRLHEKVITFLPREQIEPQALDQIFKIAKLPVVYKHVAVMPDCHLGKGATVGTVIATESAIIPAAVGVDIGCGMIAVRTKFTGGQLPDSLESLRKGIERRIPLGAGGANSQLSTSARHRVKALEDDAPADYSKIDPKWPAQVGTLGSGNHFIEVCLGEDDQVWVVLHSGSRGIGNRLAQKHIRIAQKLMDEFGTKLEDRDLAWLPYDRPEFQTYIRDLLWAQDFALANREEMMDRVMAELSQLFFKERGRESDIEAERINCHHNFSQEEEHFGKKIWVTRKGAIQMRLGQRGVIPGSMGTRSYIVSGLENPLSFHSAPHGAGRRMSRGEAKRRFTMKDFYQQMQGVECRHSPQLLDELPMAYKDIDVVMENSRELVSVDHTLKQVVNVKGD
jgi:tRNA-splicing ligase RtcB